MSAQNPLESVVWRDGTSQFVLVHIHSSSRDMVLEFVRDDMIPSVLQKLWMAMNLYGKGDGEVFKKENFSEDVVVFEDTSLNLTTSIKKNAEAFLDEDELYNLCQMPCSTMSRNPKERLESCFPAAVICPTVGNKRLYDVSEEYNDDIVAAGGVPCVFIIWRWAPFEREAVWIRKKDNARHLDIFLDGDEVVVQEKKS
jgi:hypothetical protein